MHITVLQHADSEWSPWMLTGGCQAIVPNTEHFLFPQVSQLFGICFLAGVFMVDRTTTLLIIHIFSFSFPLPALKRNTAETGPDAVSVQPVLKWLLDHPSCPQMKLFQTSANNELWSYLPLGNETPRSWMCPAPLYLSHSCRHLQIVTAPEALLACLSSCARVVVSTTP
jgi:hypothetical protein